MCARPGADPEGEHVDAITKRYYEAIQDQWPNILALYTMFEDKKPVMLYDLQDHKIYAYPYKEFRLELNERSQAILESDYESASTKGKMVVYQR
jgi:hypothetical protein